MQWRKILTPLVSAAALASPLPPAQAQNPNPGTQSGDETVLQMQQAFRKGDRKTLTQLLPSLQGHPLEAWAAYWELRARLDVAGNDEVQAFFTRWAGTYHEDRLRNDWLLLLGQRRDWAKFAQAHPQYRMSDDREVRCYALYIDHLEGRAPAHIADEARQLWAAQKNADDGCTTLAAGLFEAQKFSAQAVWNKAQIALEAGQAKAAREAVAIVAPQAVAAFTQSQASPAKYLAAENKATAKTKTKANAKTNTHTSAPAAHHSAIVALALTKLATSDYEEAAEQLQSHWGARLSAQERHWVWGVIGKRAAQRLDPEAARYFGHVARNQDLSDELLAWKARAALRAGQWKTVSGAIEAMSDSARADSTWVYWKARALLALQGIDAQAQARTLLQGIASERGFYEQLALEALGQRVGAPPTPEPLSEAEKTSARNHPALNRALYAILAGLRPEGVREWNYATNLHQRGGMSERELLAAADFACAQQVWDRCINTSERTRTLIDMGQRYPMPYRDAVVARARSIGLDPAYVYGLIRQESRFIMDARSGVGASGLMQVMPATARWTAKKIGLTDFTPEQINDRDTNITIGTAYLKLALDDFAGSMPLAAAAYNAGPGRPRNWRNGPVLEAAIWAENVPFAETRDYVKKVLANTVNYAVLLTGEPQSLQARLGQIGPREAAQSEVNKDLP